MLTSLLRTPSVVIEQPEDVYSNAVGLFLPDNVQTFHGDPGSYVTYLSKRFGDVKLGLSDPPNQAEHVLFAHRIWNSGIQMAEFISQASDDSSAERDKRWDVTGETVLEVGAGTGIVGIASALAGARVTVLSDYPSQRILANLNANVDRNIPMQVRVEKKVSVQGHEWGVLTDEYSKENVKYFTRILCADCLWADGEHYGLVQSMVHFLSPKENARAWVIAGFHTGRAKIVSFFDITDQAGLEAEEVWERDCDGNEREWEREREDKERNRWFVVAILKRKRQWTEVSNVEDKQRFFASMLMQKSNRHI